MVEAKERAYCVAGGVDPSMIHILFLNGLTTGKIRKREQIASSSPELQRANEVS